MEETLTHPIFIRQMQVGDLPFCKHLVSEAGWNQMDNDWLRAMQLEPEGCFVAMSNDSPVATTTTCCFGQIGWIAMVLVDKRNRNQGIGKLLVTHAIHYLEQKGMSTIRLDATSLGQGLYQKLGFISEYEVIRFAGTSISNQSATTNLHHVIPNNRFIPSICNLDQQITGTNRAHFINEFITAEDRPFFYTLDDKGNVDGYAGCRLGINAVQIGPAGALNRNSGEKLLYAISAHFHGKPTFIDIPVANVDALAWAENNGFTAQRSFIRMLRGEPITDFPQQIWASSGPEKG